ncbi:MAG: hypothetical protein PHT80_13670, partial [Lentisphaeria bacterium]|nr:hypothetical protein [Lentisphaeria bacterium]
MAQIIFGKSAKNDSGGSGGSSSSGERRQRHIRRAHISAVVLWWRDASIVSDAGISGVDLNSAQRCPSYIPWTQRDFLFCVESTTTESAKASGLTAWRFFRACNPCSKRLGDHSFR